MQGAIMQESRDSLRQAALSQRRSLALADCLAWSRVIQQRAIGLPQFQNASAVVLYSPIQNEVATDLLLRHALAAGQKVYLPKLAEDGADGFARIHTSSDLIKGRLGFLEPTGQEFLLPADDQRLIVFVPGVLFDRHGHRLGRGGGWYDRVLSRFRHRSVFVGLAYDCQIVDQLGAESWDQRVHLIVSESSVIDCGSMPS